MFESAILSSGPSKKRVWATCVSLTGQTLLVLFALVAPMIWPQAIPRVAWAIPLATPGPPPPPPPPPPEQPTSHARVIPTQSVGHKLYEPASTPRVAQIIVDPVEMPSTGTGPGVVGGQVGGSDNGVVGSILTQIARTAPVVKPPEPTPQQRTVAAVVNAEKPLRVVSQVELARPIHRVEPMYPTLAKQARISGVVELVGVLGTDGRIHELRVISGHPLLINAAVDAVKQWIYAPTLLNGQPVEVQAPITVNFILNR